MNPLKPGNPRDAQAGDSEEEGRRTHALDQPVEDHTVAYVGPLVNGSHHGEHQGRHYAVGEHLQHGAGQAHRMEGGDAHQHVAHVADAGNSR